MADRLPIATPLTGASFLFPATLDVTPHNSDGRRLKVQIKREVSLREAIGMVQSFLDHLEAARCLGV